MILRRHELQVESGKNVNPTNEMVIASLAPEISTNLLGKSTVRKIVTTVIDLKKEFMKNKNRAKR